MEYSGNQIYREIKNIAAINYQEITLTVYTIPRITKKLQYMIELKVLGNITVGINKTGRKNVPDHNKEYYKVKENDTRPEWFANFA